MSNLFDVLAEPARRNPDAVAIMAAGRTPLTFGTLLGQIDRVQSALNARGLGQRDRIGLLAGRGPDTAVAAVALAVSAVCVPLSDAAAPQELEDSLCQAGAKALLLPASTSSAIKDVARRRGAAVLEYCAEATAGSFDIQGHAAGTPSRCRVAAPDDLCFVMRSAGTTAKPKLIPVTHAGMTARIQKSLRLLPLTADDRCLNLMPLCYAHGLHVGLLPPLAAGSSVICPPAFDRETFLACLREFAPTWYTGGFTYHQAILSWFEQKPEAIAGHRLRFMRSGAGPLSKRVRTGLQNLFGAPMLEFYNSTEVGTIAGDSFEEGGGSETGGWIPAEDVAIMGADGSLLPPGAQGEIVVRGASVFAGYESDPDANRRAFRNGWYCTRDAGVIDAAGRLHFLGRIDDVINRGGEKVAPREIDAALLEHPAVAEAISFPVPHPTLHQDIAAAVVLRAGASATGEALRDFLAARLTAFKVPRAVVIAAELPKTQSGKLSRAEMASHFHLADVVPAGASSQPRTDTQALLLRLWQDVLNRRDIGCDDDFFLMGGDSFSAVDLLLRIEREMQRSLPIVAVAEAPTVNKLEALLTRAGGKVADTIRVHPTGSQRPLFAIAGRYGHVLRMLPLLRSLGPDQPGYALQPPGMDWAAAGCTTLPQMAAHYVERIRALQPHGPYRLIGSSFGGLVVYEIAVQLQRAGEQVEFLGLLDTAAPSFVSAEGIEIVRDPPDEEPPDPSERSLRATHVRVSVAHIAARRKHLLDARSAENLFHGEVTFFFCTGNPVVADDDSRRFWLHLCPGRLRLLKVPGVHAIPHLEPQATVLNALVRDCLKGMPVPEHTFAEVFDRDYRLENGPSGESIIAPGSKSYRVVPCRDAGRLEAVWSDAGTMRAYGWAIEPYERRPAQSIAVFLGRSFIVCGAASLRRKDVGATPAAGSAEYAGFEFILPRPAVAAPNARTRAFVLSSDGFAYELERNLFARHAVAGLITLAARVPWLRAGARRTWRYLRARRDSAPV